jgi:tetratricopeptide (TPR) repeat protein
MDFDFVYCQKLIKLAKFSDLEDYTSKQLKISQINLAQKLEFLAFAQFHLGKIKNAEFNYLKIYKFNPTSINALVYLARINSKLAKVDSSIAYYHKAIELQKNDTAILTEFGVYLSKLSKNNYAIEIFKKILAYDPNNPIILYNIALCLRDNYNYLESNEFLFKALEPHPNKHIIFNTIGVNFYDLDNFEQARLYFNKSVANKKDFVDPIINLSILEQSEGNFLEAEKLLFEVLRVEPDNAEIHRVITLGKKYTTPNDPHLLKMLELSKAAQSVNSKSLFNFALAKAYDDLKDYQLAAEYYLQGNQQRRQEFQNYNFADEIKILNSFKKTFSYNFFLKNKKLSKLGSNIIFIVGMPRSGTSMVEQIISSHSKVKGLGELNFLSESFDSFFPNIYYKDFEKLINNSNKQLFVNIGERYLQKINNVKIAKKTYLYFTDKNPLNFKLIGLIYACLPAAKIIHCKRSPQDTCLSIFKNYFSQKVMPWAYNEIELARYYLTYEELMSHYTVLLDNFIHTVDYKDLVTRPNEKIRELIQFCNLEWEDSCIDFYKNKRNVKTASVQQVREKIHSKSVDGYKNYEVLFSKLFKNLRV